MSDNATPTETEWQTNRETVRQPARHYTKTKRSTPPPHLLLDGLKVHDVLDLYVVFRVAFHRWCLLEELAQVAQAVIPLRFATLPSRVPIFLDNPVPLSIEIMSQDKAR